MKAVVCLPTMNEAESVGEVLSEIQSLGLDVFLSDANSTDGTLDIAREMGVPVYQRGENGYCSGYGCGIRSGLEVADRMGYDVFIMMDCDTTYPVQEIPALLSHIPEYDLVVGARYMKDISFLHRLVNMFHTGFCSLLYGRRLKDVNSGMRVIKIPLFNGCLTARRMGLVAQMTCFSLKNNYRVIEVPIPYGVRKGTSKVRAWDTFVVLWYIFKERFRKV